MYFATTTARDAALTGSILVDGMVSYTPATGLMYYNGTAWTAVSGATIPTSYGFTAGKNALINGDFGIWQRGTSFSVAGASAGYTADRWRNAANGTGGTITVSQQTFTPGTAPVAGYEGTYFCRYATTVVGTGASYNAFYQPIEDVRQFAGQTVTVSFWAKAAATTSVSMTLEQNFGSGGSATVVTTIPAFSITTSWARYTYSIAVPSISGKTIGTGSNLQYVFQLPYATTSTVDFWGAQIESGSTATSFQTATGTKQGELAACRRYLPAFSGTGDNFFAQVSSTTVISAQIPFDVPARVAPTGLVYSALSDFRSYNKLSVSGTPTAMATNGTGVNGALVNVTTTAGSPTLIAGDLAQFYFATSTANLYFTGCEL
jgi:hypothetical protein